MPARTTRNFVVVGLILSWALLAASCATIERVWPPPFAAGKPATLNCSACHANRTADRGTLAELCTGPY